MAVAYPMLNNFYIYRFWDENEKIIYIGKATNIYDRLYQHQHLPKDCYNSIKFIDYATVRSDAEMTIYELYYIGRFLPKYNILGKPETAITQCMEELTFLPFKEELQMFFPSSMKFKNIDLSQLADSYIQFYNSKTETTYNYPYREFQQMKDYYSISEIWNYIESHLEQSNP